MIKTLEELEKIVKPDPKRHWILPGAVRAGAKILLNGKDNAGKSLIASELAVSATTGTNFLNIIPPWITAKTLYLAGDPYQITIRIRNLLNGRGIKSSEDLRLIPAPEHGVGPKFWREIKDIVQNFKPKLIIIDEGTNFSNIHEPSSIALLKKKTQQIAHQGVTIVLCSRHADLWEKWYDTQLIIERDSTQQIFHITTPSRGKWNPLIRTHPIFLKDEIRFEPLPNCEVNEIEMKVWRALYRLNAATEGDVKKELKIESKHLISDVLFSLLEKDLVKHEHQAKSIGGKFVRVWSIKALEVEE